MFSGKKVLVCEDDVDMLESISELLSECGAEVDMYSCPKKALEHATTRPVDLILSDITMPDMSGIQLLDALNAAGVAVPLIFLTGNADIGTYRRGLIRGQFDFLTKPLVPGTLIQAVQKALQFTHDTGSIQTDAPKLAAYLANSVDE